MSLNKFMHPKNPFKHTKPDFLQLYETYESFRKVAKKNDSGSVNPDFKDPAFLKALTCCLLKDKFNLTVEIPSDR